MAERINEYALKLYFGTSLGKTATITVPKVSSSLTDPEVTTAMDKILQTGIVEVTAGKLVSKNAAELVTTIIDDIDLD